MFYLFIIKGPLNSRAKYWVSGSSVEDAQRRIDLELLNINGMIKYTAEYSGVMKEKDEKTPVI